MLFAFFCFLFVVKTNFFSFFCRWISYNEAKTLSTNFGQGLRVLGQLPRTPIAIYAETRAEWIMSALGAFSQSVFVATLYTNLGDEAVVHGINETEVREVAIMIGKNVV